MCGELLKLEVAVPDYIAVIHKNPESDYGVSFPDFPGCVTVGSSLEEAKAMPRKPWSFTFRGCWRTARRFSLLPAWMP